MLAAKLEDAMTAYNRSVADAERLIAHKNALLQRYKAEAQAAAGKVSSLQVRCHWRDVPPCARLPGCVVWHPLA